MLSSISLNTFSQTKTKNDFIAEQARKKYYEFESQFKNKKLLTQFIEYYENNNISSVKSVTEVLENPHHDLANIRKYLEYYIIKRYYPNKRRKTKIFVDVGSSARIYNSCIADVCLRPVLDSTDQERIVNYEFNVFTILSPLTFEQFIDKVGNDINKCFFNFTDTLYYIDDEAILKVNKKMDYVIYGTFTMHLVRYGKYVISFKNPLGEVHIGEDHLMRMQVIGNPSIYKHSNRFNELLNNNRTYIGEGTNIVEISKEYEFNYDNNFYICGTIKRVLNTKTSIVPSLRFPHYHENNDLKDEVKNLITKTVNLTLTTKPDSDNDRLYAQVVNSNINIATLDVEKVRRFIQLTADRFRLMQKRFKEPSNDVKNALNTGDESD
jgi:hypothetical protein